MARLLPSLRGETEEAETTLDVTVEREEPSSRKGLRKAALGLGLVALAYVASRRAGSGEIAPDELREKASDGLPADEDESMTEFVEKEIEGGEDAEDAEDEAESEGDADAEAGEDADRPDEGEDSGDDSGAEPIAEDLPGEKRSEEEIEERAEEDAHEEPAEPGEMHVDEDVVDEVVDDEESD